MKRIFLAAILISGISTISFAQKDKHMVGNDADVHGCRASAGYTWSQLKKDCVHLFEQNIKLSDVNPHGANTQAYVILSRDNKKAEIFAPETKGGVILNRSGKKGNYVWKNAGWSLTEKGGYKLKKGSRLMYKA